MSEFHAYVGLDVHKDSISVAIAEAGRDGEVRPWGVIRNSQPLRRWAPATMATDSMLTRTSRRTTQA